MTWSSHLAFIMKKFLSVNHLGIILFTFIILTATFVEKMCVQLTCFKLNVNNLLRIPSFLR
jgi:hypothetical protein